jgi:ribose transport system substrate-binding protein
MMMMLNRRGFTLLTATSALLPLGGRLAFGQETALPEAAKEIGASVVAQGPAPDPLRLAVLSFQGSSFWEATDKGIAAATSYLAPLNTTVDYIQLGTALTAETIVAGLDGALTKQYDGIALVPIFDGTVAKIDEARREDVPVVAFIADSAEKSQRNTGMGMLAYDAGHKAGEFIAQQLDGQGKIAVITGYLGAAQHDSRMNGALDYLKKEHPEIAIVGPFECKDDDATAYSQATDAMTSNPDLKIIYVTAGGSEAAAKAVRDAGQTGKVGVVGYDDLPEKQQYKDGGEILALIDQAPARQSFDSLVMLHNMLAFGADYPSEVAIDAPIAFGKLAKS